MKDLDDEDRRITILAIIKNTLPPFSNFTDQEIVAALRKGKLNNMPENIQFAIKDTQKLLDLRPQDA